MLKVLFLEDDVDQLLVYKKGFEFEGVEMVSATNGKEAKEILAQEKPDIFLVDILLKNENGLDILAEFKEAKMLEDIPVLIFTNYEKKDFRERAVKLGVLDYFLKVEYSPEDIAKKIKWLMFSGEK